MDEQPAFEVRKPDGHVFEMYVNGDAEGFDGIAIVTNRIPALLQRAYAQGMKDGADIAVTTVQAALDAIGEEP
jgi:spore maturation protein SpmB